MSTGILDGIKSQMSLIGWTDGGSPDSVRKDVAGNIIARHGDAVWIDDVQACCDRVVAAQAKAEIERRENDADDGQPDERQEWRDFDPEC